MVRDLAESNSAEVKKGSKDLDEELNVRRWRVGGYVGYVERYNIFEP
jgi:hypothetical protein